MGVLRLFYNLIKEDDIMPSSLYSNLFILYYLLGSINSLISVS